MLMRKLHTLPPNILPLRVAPHLLLGAITQSSSLLLLWSSRSILIEILERYHGDADTIHHCRGGGALPLHAGNAGTARDSRVLVPKLGLVFKVRGCPVGCTLIKSIHG